MNDSEKTRKIALLNDLCRTAMGIGGLVVQTQGIAALPAEDQSRIRELIELYDDFTEANNPWMERDLGTFEYKGETILFKIDYYNKTLDGGSEDPSDASVTTRVLTIMLQSEY